MYCMIFPRQFNGENTMARAKKAFTVDADAEIARLLILLPQNNVDQIKLILGRRFRLKYSEMARLPGHLKAIVKVRKFFFAQHVPAASRAFIVLHCLGHYYLIGGFNGWPHAGLPPGADANDLAVSLLARAGAPEAVDMVRRFEMGDMGEILDVLRGGRNSGYSRSLHDPRTFGPDDIDWHYIEKNQPEIHFF